MSVKEIKDTEDALTRLQAYFDTEEMQEGDLAKLGQLLDFLGNPARVDAFRTKLKATSAAIWKVYNQPEISAKTNRFTSAIVTVGAKYGFASQDNVVFVGALEAKAFGKRLRDGVLWKDSFALDHGEFSHSYQWLAAGLELGWETGTAALYKNLAELRSKAPLFVIDNGKLAFRRAPIWEYLVDCTNYSEERAGNAMRAPAAEAYFDKQILAFRSGKPVDRYFANQYLRMYFAAELFQGADQAWKTDYDTPEKRSRKQLEIIGILDRKPDTRGRFVAGQVANFEEQNAITGGYPGGSYRSPNNVSYLVRAKSNWFINTYQIHRTGRRAFADEAAYPPVEGDAVLVALAQSGKLGVRGEQGALALKDKFAAMEVPKLTKAGAVVPGQSVRLKSAEMKSGKRIAPGKLRLDTPIPPAELTVGDRTETFRSINKIEGARHAQHAHYQAKAGYEEIDRNVYRRPAETRGDNAKDPGREVIFHKIAGTLHATLNSSISINK